jgi:hypothetical protein
MRHRILGRIVDMLILVARRLGLNSLIKHTKTQDHDWGYKAVPILASHLDRDAGWFSKTPCQPINYLITGSTKLG